MVKGRGLGSGRASVLLCLVLVSGLKDGCSMMMVRMNWRPQTSGLYVPLPLQANEPVRTDRRVALSAAIISYQRYF